MYNQDVKNSIIKALLSGGMSGGLLGAASHAIGSAKPTMGSLLKAGLIGAGVGSGISGGSTAIGSTLMGAPSDDERSGYTRRAALGGALAGGLGGATLGGLAATGHIGLPAKAPELMKEYIRNIAKSPNALLKGAGVGAALGAIPLAYYAADEGMQLDFLKNEMLEAKKRKIRDAYDTIRSQDGY